MTTETKLPRRRLFVTIATGENVLKLFFAISSRSQRLRFQQIVKLFLHRPKPIGQIETRLFLRKITIF